MRKKIVFITGAAGEVGQALIKELSKSKSHLLVTLDLAPLPGDVSDGIHIQGDILDKALLDRLVAEYEIDTIYHLAALLSTRAEFSPETLIDLVLDFGATWFALVPAMHRAVLPHVIARRSELNRSGLRFVRS